MLTFVDWTLSRRPALGWDKATMRVVSRKCKKWLILPQGQDFTILFHHKVLFGGQHCPYTITPLGLGGLSLYIYMGEEQQGSLEKNWEIATILEMKLFERWVHSASQLLGMHVGLSLAIVWRLSVQ